MRYWAKITKLRFLSLTTHLSGMHNLWPFFHKKVSTQPPTSQTTKNKTFFTKLLVAIIQLQGCASLPTRSSKIHFISGSLQCLFSVWELEKCVTVQCRHQMFLKKAPSKKNLHSSQSQSHLLLQILSCSIKDRTVIIIKP